MAESNPGLIFCQLMTAFWVTYGYSGDSSTLAWRIPISVQCIFCECFIARGQPVLSGTIGIMSLIALPFTPESPRWLVEKSRVEEARKVMTRIYGPAYANEVILEIVEAVALEKSVSVRSSMDCFQSCVHSF